MHDTTGMYVCTIIVHMTLCKDVYIHVWFSVAAQANRIHPLCLWADVVCVSFSQATYTVPEDIGTVEIVVEADKDFTFPFQVEVSLSPDTAQCKHFSCKCHI